MRDPRFSILGIKVTVHWTWFLLLGIISWFAYSFYNHSLPGHRYLNFALAGISGVGVLVSILIHELSHSLVARKYGISADRITLFGFGAAAHLEDEVNTITPGKELKIVIVGPIASFFLAGIFLVSVNILAVPRAIHYLFLFLGSANLLLALFNLMPGFPMDGGRALRAIIWHLTGNILFATKLALWVSYVTLGILIAVAFVFLRIINALWIGAIAVFLLWPAAKAEYKAVLLKEAIKNLSVRDVMSEYPQEFKDKFIESFILEITKRGFRILYCHKGDSLWQVLRKISSERPHIIFVTENNEIIGELNENDIRNVISSRFKKL